MPDTVDTFERAQPHSVGVGVGVGIGIDRAGTADIPVPRDPGSGAEKTDPAPPVSGGVAPQRVAANLEFWRAHPQLPRRVRALLTAENTFGPWRTITQEPIPGWLSSLLAGYGEAASRLSLPARDPVLWKWCRFHLRTTAYTWTTPAPDLVAMTDRLTDVKLGLVLFNALLDDVADVLRDPELLAVFLRIPVADGEFGIAADPAAYAALRHRLARIGRPDAEDYFDLTASTWVTALGELRDAAGSAYQELRLQLAADYRHILASMRFSFDLNQEPARILRLDAAALEHEYHAPDIETILAHNANRLAFFTIDMMAARRSDPGRHRDLVASGTADIARRSSIIFQDMHIIGNALATGAREAAVDDITNEVFTTACRLIDEMEQSSIPARLRDYPDPGRDGILIAVLEHQRATEKTPPDTGPDSPAADIALLIALSGAERHCFERWLRLRADAVEALRAAGDWYDVQALLTANDRQLALHLAYQGSI